MHAPNQSDACHICWAWRPQSVRRGACLERKRGGGGRGRRPAAQTTGSRRSFPSPQNPRCLRAPTKPHTAHQTQHPGSGRAEQTLCPGTDPPAAPLPPRCLLPPTLARPPARLPARARPSLTSHARPPSRQLSAAARRCVRAAISCCARSSSGTRKLGWPMEARSRFQVLPLVSTRRRDWVTACAGWRRGWGVGVRAGAHARQGTA
jgi:hypothetical protein